MPLNFGLIADGLRGAALFHGGTKNHRRNLRRPKTWRFLYQTRWQLNFIAAYCLEKCNRRDGKRRHHVHAVMTVLHRFGPGHSHRPGRARMSFAAAAAHNEKAPKDGAKRDFVIEANAESTS